MYSKVTTFFAIERKHNETPHQLAAIVLYTAVEVRSRFQRLDTLDIIDIGGKSFVRFQSDVINPFPLLDRLLKDGRANISASPGSYLLRSDRRSGKVSGVPMHMVPMDQYFRQYNGPRSENWRDQFSTSSHI